MPRVLLVAALVLALAGCARTPGHTAEVHGADAGRFYATLYHFLTATNDYERASYVHDSDKFREEMGRHFAGRPPVARVRVDAVEAEAGNATTVTAPVSYADGTAGVVKVVVRKGDPAWLVDWPATRALWE
jgi:hypothetical protein